MASEILSNLTNPLITDHPYYPIEVEIASYLANEWSVPVLLAAFGSVCAAVLLAAQIVVDKLHPNLRTAEKATIWWFVLCIAPSPSTLMLGPQTNDHSRMHSPLLRRYETTLPCVREIIDNCRLLRCQPHSDGPETRSLRPAVEGVFPLRLPLPDL